MTHYRNIKYLIQNKLIIIFTIVTLFTHNLFSQTKNVSDYFSIDSYGRIGVDWSFENQGSIGRRLNLNNMGSIGGRLEEQDYLEIAPAFHFKPLNETDSTLINVQLRFSMYSQSLSFFGNSTTSSIGGLTLGIPEMYVEAKNIGNKPLTIWVGARMNRQYDVHISDHFYFNDHTGQGVGIEYRNSRFSTVFVSSTDTSSTLPPYFYLNNLSGTPTITLRQRYVFILEQDINLSLNLKATLLGEYHYMGNDIDDDIEIPDSIDIILDYKSDFGIVLGARFESTMPNMLKGASNKSSVRYGNRIANGGDGGLSHTWLTYGAPDLNKKNYAGAYALKFVNDFIINTSDNNTLNVYTIIAHSKGSAKSDTTAKTYFGKEVFNKKTDFTIGFRNTYYLTNKIHLLSECHYSQRQDGTLPTYSMVKFSFAPTLTPTGVKEAFARPHIRLVTSVARYNDAAMDNLYSPYLNFAGKKRWGYYLGVKAEWWL